MSKNDYAGELEMFLRELDGSFYEREEQPRWCSVCERWDEDCVCDPETPVERAEPFSATELREHIEKLCHGLPVREIGGYEET